jgi:hypothetical protein
VTTSPNYEYKSVRVPDDIDQLQPFLDHYSRNGWRLVQTFVSMGYTVGMIFERQLKHPGEMDVL